MPIFGHKEMIPLKRLPIQVSIFTVRKRSLRRLCFYTCLSFCSRGRGSPGPYPEGRLGGLAWGCLQAHTQGRGWGVWQGGSPGPYPGGRLGVWLGGVYSSIHWGRTPPPPLQQTATAADGTHHTGIHSKATLFVLLFCLSKNFTLVWSHGYDIDDICGLITLRDLWIVKASCCDIVPTNHLSFTDNRVFS